MAGNRTLQFQWHMGFNETMTQEVVSSSVKASDDEGSPGYQKCRLKWVPLPTRKKRHDGPGYVEGKMTLDRRHAAVMDQFLWHASTEDLEDGRFCVSISNNTLVRGTAIPYSECQEIIQDLLDVGFIQRDKQKKLKATRLTYGFPKPGHWPVDLGGVEFVPISEIPVVKKEKVVEQAPLAAAAPAAPVAVPEPTATAPVAAVPATVPAPAPTAEKQEPQPPRGFKAEMWTESLARVRAAKHMGTGFELAPDHDWEEFSAYLRFRDPDMMEYKQERFEGFFFHLKPVAAASHYLSMLCGRPIEFRALPKDVQNADPEYLTDVLYTFLVKNPDNEWAHGLQNAQNPAAYLYSILEKMLDAYDALPASLDDSDEQAATSEPEPEPEPVPVPDRWHTPAYSDIIQLQQSELKAIAPFVHQQNLGNASSKLKRRLYQNDFENGVGPVLRELVNCSTTRAIVEMGKLDKFDYDSKAPDHVFNGPSKTWVYIEVPRAMGMRTQIFVYMDVWHPLNTQRPSLESTDPKPEPQPVAAPVAEPAPAPPVLPALSLDEDEEEEPEEEEEEDEELVEEEEPEDEDYAHDVNYCVYEDYEPGEPEDRADRAERLAREKYAREVCH